MPQPSLLEFNSLIQREAQLLDQRRWDDWLAMFTDDCQFWIPTWRDENTLIENPKREVSFLYATGRATLEERIRRIVQGKSITTAPLPRTCHLVSGATQLPGESPDTTCCNWTNHLYDPRTHTTQLLYGRYIHRWTWRDDEWRIAAKTIILTNDRVPTVLDLYSV